MMSSLTIHGFTENQDRVLTPEFSIFLEKLMIEFASNFEELLELRTNRQAEFDRGLKPDFATDTENIRLDDWQVAPVPKDLWDRRVEITGSASDAKAVIHALNANVKCFMADFEDSLVPSWANIIAGQCNLQDAIAGTLRFEDQASGTVEQLQQKTALLLCRVRGLHLPEAHICFKGKAVPGSLFDFAGYLFHNHVALRAKGSGVYFYLPKLEDHGEAQLWADVFKFSETYLSIPQSTIRATIMIETFPSVFQMHEILYALRDYAVALTCGRWDYIFSYIKTLSTDQAYILADRGTLGMDSPFLSAYSRLLIQTCHQRGVLAMGGMAAFVPSRDKAVNVQALEKVRFDKQLEADNGHDGTWIAHPGLANTALAVFDQAIHKNASNQTHIMREEDRITTQDLYLPPPPICTEIVVRNNIKIAVQYIEAWLCGNGYKELYHLMEDAATAEISRASIWQLMKYGLELENGKILSADYFNQLLDEECQVIQAEIGDAYQSGKFPQACAIFKDLVLADKFPSFLTLPCYQQVITLLPAGDYIATSRLAKNI